MRLLHQVRRDPHLDDIDRSRWTLAHLLQVSKSWLRVRSPSGMWRLLHRLPIHYKRARMDVHSADPHYQAKLARIETLRKHTQEHRAEEVFL
jgi:hypothetical protein